MTYYDLVTENEKLKRQIKKLKEPNYENAAFQDGLLDRIQELEQQIKDIRNEVLDDLTKKIKKDWDYNGVFYSKSEVIELITKLRQKETQQ